MTQGPGEREGRTDEGGITYDGITRPHIPRFLVHHLPGSGTRMILPERRVAHVYDGAGVSHVRVL